MRRMFTWRQIPKMLELKALLLAAIEEHRTVRGGARGNLLGECDLILSFLCYNDISAMSRLHRSASAQMSRPAISIQSGGGWTFGSPSVLMMFYRAPGDAGLTRRWTSVCPTTIRSPTTTGRVRRPSCAPRRCSVRTLHRCPHRAGARLRAGEEQRTGQHGAVLRFPVAAARDIPTWSSGTPLPSATRRLLRYHDAAWINLWSATSAYYHALRGETDKIPGDLLASTGSPLSICWRRASP